MKVWLVAVGEYSDYGVVGLFSTEEKAKEYCDFFADKHRWYAPFVDGEFIIDEGLEIVEARKAGRKLFNVFMERDGSVKNFQKFYDGHYPTSFDLVAPPIYDRRVMLRAYVWAKDEEHAIKITNEKRMQFIALNMWGE